MLLVELTDLKHVVASWGRQLQLENKQTQALLIYLTDVKQLTTITLV